MRHCLRERLRLSRSGTARSRKAHPVQLGRKIVDRGQSFGTKLPLAVIICHPHQLEHIGMGKARVQQIDKARMMKSEKARKTPPTSA